MNVGEVVCGYEVKGVFGQLVTLECVDCKDFVKRSLGQVARGIRCVCRNEPTQEHYQCDPANRYEDDREAQRFVADHPSGAELQEIGAALGISVERVRQIEVSALENAFINARILEIDLEAALEGLNDRERLARRSPWA